MSAVNSVLRPQGIILLVLGAIAVGLILAAADAPPVGVVGGVTLAAALPVIGASLVAGNGHKQVVVRRGRDEAVDDAEGRSEDPWRDDADLDDASSDPDRTEQDLATATWSDEPVEAGDTSEVLDGPVDTPGRPDWVAMWREARAENIRAGQDVRGADTAPPTGLDEPQHDTAPAEDKERHEIDQAAGSGVGAGVGDGATPAGPQGLADALDEAERALNQSTDAGDDGDAVPVVPEPEIVDEPPVVPEPEIVDEPAEVQERDWDAPVAPPAAPIVDEAPAAAPLPTVDDAPRGDADVVDALVIDNVPVAMVVVDGAGIVVRANPAAHAVLGTVAVGERWTALPPMQRADGATTHPVEVALAGDLAADVTVVVPAESTPDRPRPTVLVVTASPLRGESGAQGAVLVIRPIAGSAPAPPDGPETSQGTKEQP